jgi:hypothetical protein
VDGGIPVSSYGTRFQETEAILAAQEGDMAEVERIVREMPPGERQALFNAASRLAYTIKSVQAMAEESR